MKTNAPGKFDCEVYLKAWQLGIRGDDVMAHIDKCWWCGPQIHGHPEEFPLSIEEEAEIRLTARRRARRRRFLKATAASVIGISAIGFGLHALLSPNPPPFHHRTKHAKTLDELHAQAGDAAIISRFGQANESEAMRILRWIQKRDKTSLYNVIVDSLRDSRPEVQKRALHVIRRIAPADLMPYLGDIEAARDALASPDQRHLLDRLIASVEDS